MHLLEHDSIAGQPERQNPAGRPGHTNHNPGYIYVCRSHDSAADVILDSPGSWPTRSTSNHHAHHNPDCFRRGRVGLIEPAICFFSARAAQILIRENPKNECVQPISINMSDNALAYFLSFTATSAISCSYLSHAMSCARIRNNLPAGCIFTRTTNMFLAVILGVAVLQVWEPNHSRPSKRFYNSVITWFGILALAAIDRNIFE